MLVVGLVIQLCAKKEKLRINKAEDRIYVEYKNVFYSSRIEGRYLHNLKQFVIVRKGFHTFQENSIHYVMRFEFEGDDVEPLEVAQTKRFAEIKKKYV